MLCDTCKNKHICKHFEYFKNISINLIIKIDHCELFSNNQQVAAPSPPTINVSQPTYRQPLPSTIEDEVDILEEEDEERVIIDLNNYEDKPQTSSIVDLFLKGELADDQEKN